MQGLLPFFGDGIEQVEQAGAEAPEQPAAGGYLSGSRGFQHCYPVLARDGFPEVNAVFVEGIVNGMAQEFVAVAQDGPRVAVPPHCPGDGNQLGRGGQGVVDPGYGGVVPVHLLWPGVVTQGPGPVRVHL